MASQGMVLRNLALVGKTANVPMPPQSKPIFEEGCYLIFLRWTALQLAIQNEWGGSSSRQKAQELLEEVIGWFYSTKDYEPSDLEVLLDEAIQVDFNVLAEDDSPYQVARSLVNMHNQVAGGDTSYVDQLRQMQPIGTTASQKVERPADAEADSSSSDDDDGGGSDADDAMDVEGGEDMEMDEVPPQQPQGPIIDEDGFELVQKKGKGRR